MFNTTYFVQGAVVVQFTLLSIKKQKDTDNKLSPLLFGTEGSRQNYLPSSENVFYKT